MIPEYLRTMSEWGASFAFWSAVGFIIFSGTAWPWWQSQWGVNIISLEIAIALALLEPVMAYDFGLHGASDITLAWVEMIALWLVGFIILWRGLLVLSAQLNGAFGTGILNSVKRLRRRLASPLGHPRTEPLPETAKKEQRTAGSEENRNMTS